jgi:hypothetical protein
LEWRKGNGRGNGVGKEKGVQFFGGNVNDQPMGNGVEFGRNHRKWPLGVLHIKKKLGEKTGAN